MMLDFRFLPVIVKQALNISCVSIWILPLESLWFVLSSSYDPDSLAFPFTAR